jgi:uncharacterized protein YabN with tetrapyrrole methylase and pyrophosphatase domain
VGSEPRWSSERWAGLEAELEAALEAAGETEPVLLGELLFAIAGLARRRRLDPESVLRAVNQQFKARLSAVELAARQSGRSLQELSREELKMLWQSLRTK